ncbi:MAG: CDP-diacylglycerol--serine O-phosphatidyltransferase [Endozoicomonadaceae bacterium]|nr:CDP-diacylglycerol--serine O-phosphatidyltransferase [Endozoicomonadaceae bacterium]
MSLYDSSLKNENAGRLGVQPNHIEILYSTKIFQMKIFELIKQATQKIYISALYFEYDEVGEAILEALYLSKERNPAIDIVLLVDFHRAQRQRFGEKHKLSNADYYLQRNAASRYPIKIYGLPVKKREFLGVMHLKGFIFDETVLYSGASINNIYFYFKDRYRYDRYIVIQDKALSDSMSDFVQHICHQNEAVTSLTDQNKPSIKAIRIKIKDSIRFLKQASYQFKGIQSDQAGMTYITPLIGFGRRGNKLNKTIIDMIKSSKNNVILYTPYFNLPSELKKTLKKAMKRNVVVTLVLGDKKASDFYIQDLTQFTFLGALPFLYETVLRQFILHYKSYIDNHLLKICIWRHDYHSFHLKGVSVDQKEYLLTGSNLNPRAWGLDLENALFIEDPSQELKIAFQKEHDIIMQRTTVVRSTHDLDDPVSYPDPVKRILGRLRRIRADHFLKKFM